MRNVYFLVLSLLTTISLNAQYIDGSVVKYGNEWIDYDAEYFKITVNEDGIYRVTKQELEEMGFPVGSVEMSQFAMFNIGEEIEIYTSGEGLMGDEDVIEFYGKRNRNELDKFMFDNKQHQLNPNYSLITDNNAYYLSYNVGDQKRYLATDTEFSNSLPPLESYYLAEYEKMFTNGFSKVLTAAVRYSSPVVGEGFGRGYLPVLNFTASVPHFYDNGPKPKAEFRCSTNNAAHNIKISINNQEVENYQSNGYQVVKDEFEFDRELMKTSLPIKIDPDGESSDRMSLAYFRIKYPATFNFNNKNFARLKFEASPFDRYMELEDFNFNSGTPVFYDVLTKRRITSEIEDDIVRIQVPGSLENNDFFVVTNGSVKSIVSAEPVQFNNFADQGNSYLIITHSSLLEDENTGNNYIQEYSDYRSSAEGGNHNVQIIDIEEVYETFGYGIEKHHLSLRTFINHAYKTWDDLSYVFIIGKGREYGFYRSNAQQAEDTVFHVPTYGFPGSDNLLAAEWGDTKPVVPIGRLAVRKADQIRIYLNKVKEHENPTNLDQTIQNKQWAKRVLHMSGGDPTIQSNIRNMLGNMEDVIENNAFGGDVTTFYKTSSDPIENSQAEAIKEIIDDGVSILTFFGHSAVGVFDLSLEDVDAYNNKGKYNILLSLGCHSGNIHTGATGLSEDFVLAEDKGSVAFLAASSQAYIPNQYTAGLELYENLGQGLYDKTLGETVLPILEKFEPQPGYAWETLLQQFTYHGDPALKMNSSLGPDYTPRFSSVKNVPEVVNAFQDSFSICVNVANLGLAVDTTFSINVQHLNPENKILFDSSFVVRTPSYESTYCFSIPITSIDVVGKNSIKIFVEDKNEYEEWPDPAAENNNRLVNTLGGDTYEFYILNNGAVPVEPKNYAIYNKPDVILQASSFNALGDKQDFVFQLDTVESFDSPFMTEEILVNTTGLLSWTPDVSFSNNVVYYWRVSPESDPTGPGRVWNSSSFVYLPNSSSGWSQSHIDQFEDNEFDELKFTNGELDYVENLRGIRVINRVSTSGNYANFFISEQFWGNAYYINKGPLIAIVTADSLGRFDRNDSPGKYGSEQPANQNCLAFYFDPTDQQSRINMVNFIEDIIEEGDYVFFYTVHRFKDYTSDFMNFEWESDSDENNGRNIFTTLENQGAVIIDSLKNNVLTPYNFFFQKDKEALAEDLAESIEAKADSRTDMFGKWFTGTETSVKVGPSRKWRKLVWKEEKSEIAENDSSYVRVYGVTVDGKDSLLRDEVYDAEINLAQISAEEFPYLKLEYFSFDNKNLSSPNLIFWRVFYDGTPELALDASDPEFVFKADSLDQGDEFLVRIPLRNIGSFDVDSVDVKIILTDQANEQTEFSQVLTSLKVGETDMIELELETYDYSGSYTLTIEANSRKTPEECFYFNNFGLRTFTISKDLRNPLLDVSFDGRRILNGDIVSSEPIIRIVTKDENKYLLLNDTADYQINLIDPDGINLVIPLEDERIIFNPATDGNNNQSEIIFTPTLAKDGRYTLEVRSKDKSGNLSGNNDYAIEFEVINEELISNVFNYPNPFSDCTQFVFTLTGNELPEDINIRIMTVSGKVVKEISGAELGPLQIGVNRTEYRWCGTDEFNSKLANGVYLYQVTTKKQSGEVYEKYDTNTDNFFKNNIGKLVIIR